MHGRVRAGFHQATWLNPSDPVWRQRQHMKLEVSDLHDCCKTTEGLDSGYRLGEISSLRSCVTQWGFFTNMRPG